MPEVYVIKRVYLCLKWLNMCELLVYVLKLLHYLKEGSAVTVFVRNSCETWMIKF